MKKQMQYILLLSSLFIIGMFQNLQLTIIISLILGLMHAIILKTLTLRLIIEWFISLYILNFMTIIFTIKGYDIYELLLGPLFTLIIPFLVYSIAILATILLYKGFQNKIAGKRIPYILLSLVMYFVIIFSYNHFFSNPISALLAKNNMQEYVDLKYPGLDLTIQNIHYNFKFNSFEGIAVSKNAYHNLEITYYQTNKEIVDNYTTAIANKENITSVLSSQYDELIKENLENYEYLYVIGSIENINTETFGLDTTLLDMNQMYNALDFASNHGSIFIRVQGELTIENLIVQIQAFKEQVDVPFYQISRFVIVNGNSSIIASNILYEQINQETLSTIITEDTVEYY